MIHLQSNHAQMRGVFQHHFGHQVPSCRPCLEFPRLLPNVPPKLPIIILWPMILGQPSLQQFNGSLSYMRPPCFDASCCEQPYEHCPQQNKSYTLDNATACKQAPPLYRDGGKTPQRCRKERLHNHMYKTMKILYTDNEVEMKACQPHIPGQEPPL